MCERVEVQCNADEIDYGTISDVVYDSSPDYADDLEEINNKLTIMAMMILRTSGYTNTFKLNPKDNRKHIGKNVKELADVFGIQFKKWMRKYENYWYN